MRLLGPSVVGAALLGVVIAILVGMVVVSLLL